MLDEQEYFRLGLRDIMEQTRFGPTELGSKSGIHRNVISSFLSGNRPAGLKSQARLAAALGYETADIVAIGRKQAGRAILKTVFQETLKAQDATGWHFPDNRDEAIKVIGEKLEAKYLETEEGRRILAAASGMTLSEVFQDILREQLPAGWRVPNNPDGTIDAIMRRLSEKYLEITPPPPAPAWLVPLLPSLATLDEAGQAAVKALVVGLTSVRADDFRTRKPRMAETD